MSKEEILKKAYWSKKTIYDKQLCYDLPNGLTISIVKTKKYMSKKFIEDRLFEKVNEKLLLNYM